MLTHAPCPLLGARYVALGTSISMGWQSDGVYFAGQLVSWPSLLSVGAANPITLPLIQSPGCVLPLVPPLGAGKRLSGESAAGSVVCAPNVAGVTLPTQNVGIAGALAADAVATPSPGPANVHSCSTPDIRRRGICTRSSCSTQAGSTRRSRS